MADNKGREKYVKGEGKEAEVKFVYPDNTDQVKAVTKAGFKLEKEAAKKADK